LGYPVPVTFIQSNLEGYPMPTLSKYRTISQYFQLSEVEDILFPLIKRATTIQSIQIQRLIGATIQLIEMIDKLGVVGLEVGRVRKVKGGRGDMEGGWVVEVGVYHLLSKNNSPKIFKKKYTAERALVKHRKEIHSMIRSYTEEEPEGLAWLGNLGSNEPKG